MTLSHLKAFCMQGKMYKLVRLRKKIYAPARMVKPEVSLACCLARYSGR